MPSRNPSPTGVNFSAGGAELRDGVGGSPAKGAAGGGAPPAHAVADVAPASGEAAAEEDAEEPVAWLSWGTAAFARAQAEQRPVLLSIAVSWSAACRAQHERLSARDAETSHLRRLIRDRIVPIRVDADRRPDIAERYTQGGWPTLLLLTPEGEPLAGVEGDAATLARIITAAADALRTQRRELALRADAMRRERREAEAARASCAGPASSAVPAGEPAAPAPLIAHAPEITGQDDTAILDDISAQLAASFDREHGGFCVMESDEASPKFPLASPLAFALWQGTRLGDARLVDIALVTLDRMSSGALSSPDGAFHRCCAAADWSAPDEAVLLETQAELIPLYLDAWTLSGADTFRDRALACLAFVTTTLEDQARGGFFASRAPDDSVDRLLLTDANARMASALVRAGRALEDSRLIERAARALERLLPVVYQRGAGVAHLLVPGSPAEHAGNAADDAAQVRGLLNDQVQMSAALLDAGVAAGEPVYIELAEELMRSALRRFAHRSGLLADRIRSAAGAGDVGLLADPLHPFATNAAAARVLLRLGRDAARPDLLAAADALLQPLRASYRGHGIVAADLGLALLERLGP